MFACDETVTFVRHIEAVNEDRYEVIAAAGVSWYGRRGVNTAANGANPTAGYTVRIPATVVPDPPPAPGDICVKGVLTEYSGRKSLNGREYFVISTVGDNRRGALAHVVVKSE